MRFEHAYYIPSNLSDYDAMCIRYSALIRWVIVAARLINVYFLLKY